MSVGRKKLLSMLKECCRFFVLWERNDATDLSTDLVGKHCLKFGNALLSKRVAATRCPVTANLEQQCDTTISQTSSKSLKVPHQRFHTWASSPLAPQLQRRSHCERSLGRFL